MLRSEVGDFFETFRAFGILGSVAGGGDPKTKDKTGCQLLGSRLPSTRPEFLDFAENRQGKEQIVFSGEGRRNPKLSLALEQPRLALGVALEQETILGLSGPRPKSLLAPSLILECRKWGVKRWGFKRI